jgi:Hypothetical glycosyl hydrolase family 15
MSSRQYALSRPPMPRWFAILVPLLILSGCTSSSTADNQQTTAARTEPGIRQFADTWNNIHVFQTFDYNISNPAAIAKRYDFVWGAEAYHVSAWRSSNRNIFISYYFSFNHDQGPFSDSTSFYSLTYWKATHPDWILYKCDRITPAYSYGEPNVPLDFANPSVISWQVRTYAQPASVAGYDGIAADNVSLENSFGACGVYKNGRWIQHYSGQPNDPQWRADVLNWLKKTQQALHTLKHPLALIANFSLPSPLCQGDPQLLQVVSYTDGLVDEDGFSDPGSGYLTGNSWLQKVRFIELVQKRHKAYYLINEFPTVGRAEIQWAIASYLMSKGHLSSLFISTIQGYGAVLWHNEYNAPIGSPVGPMYQSQHVYLRNFSNGLSIVNPSATETYVVVLSPGSHYVDLYGKPAGQILSMPPHSGIVLLGLVKK